MKVQTLIFAAMLASAGGAEAALYSFSSSVNQVIPDGNINGLSSVINASAGDNSIQSLSVTINVSGGYTGDLYAYLTHGSGFSVLLNRTGATTGNNFGYDNAGFAIALSDSGANNIHLYQNFSPSYNGNGQLTGTWQADGRNINPLSSGATFDSTSPSTPLSGFNSLDPNGGWTLFFADVVGGGNPSTLVSWSLDITAVPEPIGWALIIFGASFAAIHIARQTLRLATGPVTKSAPSEA
jgi:subtilisin-like proprotein convertase family protein